MSPGAGVQLEESPGNWIDSYECAVVQETLNQFYAVFDTLDDITGKAWRLVPPVTTWEASGRLLAPTSGVFVAEPMMGMAAKIAAIEPLTRKRDLLK